jgi:predicted methyltransferase
LRGEIKLAIVASIEVHPIVKKKTTAKAKGSSRFHRDKRRKHRHWQVTVYYQDGEKFGRVYIDRERAERFAERQKKSPVVKATRILEVD